MSLGKYPDAFLAARSLVERFPDFAAGHAVYGRVLVHFARLPDVASLKGAIQEFERAISLDPDVHEYHMLLADALTRLGHQSEAQASVRRALDLSKECGENFDSDISTRLGVLPVNIEDYEMAIRLDPNNQSNYENLAVVLGDLKRFEEGLEVCERWKTRFPSAAYPLYFKALYLQEMGRNDEAAEICLKLIVKIEDGEAGFDAKALYGLSYLKMTLGKACLALGRPQDAARCLAESLQLDAASFPTQCDLGEAYAAMGDIKAAILQWRFAKLDQRRTVEDGDTSARAATLLSEYTGERQVHRDFWTGALIDN